MKSFFKIGIVIIILGLGAVIFIFSFYREIREYFNPNELILTVHPPLDKKKVTIVWSNDVTKNDTIFLNGIDLGKKYKEYGKNYFDVYYDKKFIGQYGHLKTCNWEGHKYYVTITLVKDSIVLDWKITGAFPDSKQSNDSFTKSLDSQKKI